MIHIEPTAFAIEQSAVLYRNVLAEGSLGWSSQTADGFAANALGPQTFDAWVPSAMPANLNVTLAAPVECDCAAIIAHTLGSSGATAYVESRNATTGAWTLMASVTPTDDSNIVLLFSDVSGTAYNQWRIRVTGPTIPAIGVAMIGPRLLIPGGTLSGYVPVNLALSVDLLPNTTRGGQFLGNRVQKVGAGTSIPLCPQERWWVESEASAFIAHYNLGKPFIWMSCPELLPEDGSYCWRSGATLSATFDAGAVWGDMSMEVAAHV